MYYFKYVDKGIEKYNVTFKKEQLENLKSEIIKNGGILVHREFNGTIGPDTSDNIRISNFSKEKTGIKNEKNEELYHFSYDELLKPYLSILITRIIKGDAKALDELMKHDTDEEMSPIEYLTFYGESQELLLQEKYYSIARNMLSFELIDTITFEELIKVDEFLGRNLPFNKRKVKRK